MSCFHNYLKLFKVRSQFIFQVACFLQTISAENICSVTDLTLFSAAPCHAQPQEETNKSTEEELQMDRGLRHLRWDEGWAHTLLCAVNQALTMHVCAWSGALMEVLFLLFLMPFFLPTWPHQTT